MTNKKNPMPRIDRSDIAPLCEMLKKKPIYFARICSYTNEPMNEGWVVNDGEEYIKHEDIAIKAVNDMGYKSINEAYKDNAIYWTEWEQGDTDDMQCVKIGRVHYEIED